jgi:hypothetical protein
MRRACWHCEQSPAISNVGFSGAIIFIDDREAVHGSDNYPGTFSQSLNAFTFFCGMTYSVADLYHRHKAGKKTAD